MGMRGVECGGTSVQCNVKTGEKRLDIYIASIILMYRSRRCLLWLPQNKQCISNTFGILKEQLKSMLFLRRKYIYVHFT